MAREIKLFSAATSGKSASASVAAAIAALLNSRLETGMLKSPEKLTIRTEILPVRAPVNQKNPFDGRIYHAAGF
jgi:hypothetical protein